jgi:hypothetical protein
MNQIKFQFDQTTIEKTLIHCAIIGGSAAAIYLIQILSGYNFGVYQVPAMAILSWVGTAIKEWMSGVPAAGTQQ